MTHIFNHPLLKSKMALIRDKNTNTKDFRELVNEVAKLITYEITRELSTKKISVETPVGVAECEVVDSEIVIVPILRAGLGMLDGILSIIPNAKVGFIGLYRNEKTLEPVEYYFKVPVIDEKTTVFLLDPMLATGGSAKKGIELLKSKGAKNIKYIGLVGCPEGIRVLEESHPDVDIFLVEEDEKLNNVGYIVPGLGDCGDRLFGTK